MSGVCGALAPTSLCHSVPANTHSVSVLTELAWPSMLIIMSSTFPVTGTVMTCSDPGLSWVWPLTWSPGRLGSRTVHLPSSNPKGSLQKKPKKFHLLKRPFLTKKVRWFLSHLGGGAGSEEVWRLSHFFFLKASLTLANNFDSSWRWDHWWWYQRWCDTVLWAVTVIIIILPWKCWLIISECCLHRISSLATVNNIELDIRPEWAG